MQCTDPRFISPLHIFIRCLSSRRFLWPLVCRWELLSIMHVGWLSGLVPDRMGSAHLNTIPPDHAMALKMDV